MTRIDALVHACRQAAGIAGNCERGTLLVNAADCLEECRDTAAVLTQVMSERDAAIAERAEVNKVALRLVNREADMCRALRVADGGRWITDWEAAIGQVVKERDAALARVRELEGEISGMLADELRKNG